MRNEAESLSNLRGHICLGRRSAYGQRDHPPRLARPHVGKIGFSLATRCGSCLQLVKTLTLSQLCCQPVAASFKPPIQSSWLRALSSLIASARPSAYTRPPRHPRRRVGRPFRRRLRHFRRPGQDLGRVAVQRPARPLGSRGTMGTLASKPASSKRTATNSPSFKVTPPNSSWTSSGKGRRLRSSHRKTCARPSSGACGRVWPSMGGEGYEGHFRDPGGYRRNPWVWSGTPLRTLTLTKTRSFLVACN